MSRQILCWFWGGVLAISLSPAPVQARHRPAPPAAQGVSQEEILVRERYRAARALLDAGNLTGARELLQRAYAEVPTPFFLWPLAELYLKLQQPREGLRALDRYEEQVPRERMPEGQRSAEVAQLRWQLIWQQAELELQTDEPGALLLVDGQEVGRAPLSHPVPVNPGVHRIEGHGAHSVTKEVQLWPGQHLRVVLSPPPAQKAPAPPVPRTQRPGGSRWLLLSTGAAALIAGAALWGLDGHQSCSDQPYCSQELDTRLPGVALLSAGLGLLGASAVVLFVDYRAGHGERERASVNIMGRF